MSCSTSVLSAIGLTARRTQLGEMMQVLGIMTTLFQL